MADSWSASCRYAATLWGVWRREEERSYTGSGPGASMSLLSIRMNLRHYGASHVNDPFRLDPGFRCRHSLSKIPYSHAGVSNLGIVGPVLDLLNNRSEPGHLPRLGHCPAYPSHAGHHVLERRVPTRDDDATAARGQKLCAPLHGSILMGDAIGSSNSGPGTARGEPKVTGVAVYHDSCSTSSARQLQYLILCQLRS